MSHHTTIAHMLDAHPAKNISDRESLEKLIAALYECAETCTACADACLGEENVAKMVRCIRTDLDCADICAATARVVSRQTELDEKLVRAQVEACRTACERCGSECDRHSEKMEHCKLCAEVCHRCAEACRAFSGT